jgi:hypothetical protein
LLLQREHVSQGINREVDRIAAHSGEQCRETIDVGKVG